jgi:hypothetical protein
LAGGISSILGKVRAREAQGDMVVDDIAALEERMLKPASDPNFIHSEVGRSVISSKQWRASKLAPKKYGDRKIISGDADNPLTVQHTRVLDGNAYQG